MSDKYSEIEKAFQIYSQGRDIPDKVPEGWFTAIEYSKRASCSIPTAHRHIRQLIDKGHVQTKAYKIKSGGRLYPVPHYRIQAKGRKAS